MPRAENLTVTGKCFLPTKLEDKIIPRLKFAISEYMLKSGYIRQDVINPFLDDPYLCLKFMLGAGDYGVSFRLRLLRRFNLISKSKYNTELYFSYLRTKVDDVPFEVTFIITPPEYKEKEGVGIEIISKPAISFKINQLHANFPYDEFKYSKILASNIEFIYEIMKALNSNITENPAVISDYSKEMYKLPIIYELEKYGFHKVAKIFKEGLNKLKNGKVKDSLDELRAVIEIFTKEIADKKGDKNYPQDKIKNNIEVLKTANILNDEMSGILISVYYNNLYSYISDNVSHKRNELVIRDGEFIFSLVEDYIKYIIKKAVE